MARRTENDLGEAIRLVRVAGGKRTIKENVNSTKKTITSSRRGYSFIEYDEDRYRRNLARTGTRRM